MALTAALAMTLGTAPAEQPGYAGHLVCYVTPTFFVLFKCPLVKYTTFFTFFKCPLVVFIT